MLLQKLEITNFLSIAEATIEFPSSGLMLISGWNNTLGRSNGAGKSTIMQALCWVLYGEMPRNVKVDEIIRRGQSSCSVSVHMSISDVSWVVTRKRPVDISVTRNGEKLKGNPKLLQSIVEQEIGFNYSQFLVTSYFPQNGSGSRFLNQKDSSAKEFLGVILNFSRAEQGYKKLHLLLKDAETELSKANFKLNTLCGNVNSLTALNQMPIPDLPNKEEVKAVKESLDLVKQQALAPPDTTEVDSKIEFIKKKQKAAEQLKYQASTLKSKVDSLKTSISNLKLPHYMTCPSCSEHLIEKSNDLVVFDDASAEAVRKAKEDDFNNQILENNLKLKEFNLTLSKAGNLNEALDKLSDEKASLKSDYLVAIQKQKTLEAQLTSFRRMYEAHQAAKEQVAKVGEQMVALQVQIEEANALVLSLEGDIKVLSAAKQVMSPMGAIAYSLDSVIDEINNEVTSYLDIFSHSTMSYKMSSGEDKAKITHHVTHDGEEVSVGSLSGGEEKGLILSVDLGLSEVLANRCGVPLPSVLMLDECFDGLDYIGKEKVLDALKELSVSRCIIVVDHSTEFSSLFTQRIKVIKDNGISTVVIE